jgi:hypothetical protein
VLDWIPVVLAFHYFASCSICLQSAHNLNFMLVVNETNAKQQLVGMTDAVIQSDN